MLVQTPPHRTTTSVILCILLVTVLAMSVLFLASCGDDDKKSPTVSYPTGSWEWTAIPQGVDWEVEALADYDDKLFVGGNFDSAGVIPAHNIAVLDDTAWSTYGSGASSDVMAFCERNGELIVAGNFTHIDGTPYSRIALWNGSSWSSLGVDINGAIWALTVFDGALIIGGEFNSPALHLMVWDGSNWGGLRGGTDGPVFALTTYDDKLYVGGHFKYAGGVECHNIAAFTWLTVTPLTDGVALSSDTSISRVWSLETYNNRLYVGGLFDQAGGVSANNIASYSPTGWLACGQGVQSASGGGQPIVRALAVSHDLLVVGGDFELAGGVERRYLALWNGYGWLGTGGEFFGEDAASNVPHVGAIHEYNNRLYVGGYFSLVDGQSARNMAYGVFGED